MENLQSSLTACKDKACITSAITLLSSPHGRMRRAQRLIEKRDLQAALKYGRKEPALPTSAGERRWKYTYADVVFITDSSSTKEITSWTTPGAGLDVEFATITDSMMKEHRLARQRIRDSPSWWTSHTVVVVDQSGSMRKTDVKGGATRSDAVWLTLALDFVGKGLRDGMYKASDVITVVDMRLDSSVLIDREPIDWVLFNNIISLLRSSEPMSHGNYIPALRRAEELLSSNPSGSCALMLLFLSDGKPSDKTPASEMSHRLSSLEKLQGIACLQIDSLASRFGRRLKIAAIGFAGPEEDFSTLQKMAARPSEFGSSGAFQAVSLNPESLGLALQSLTSTLTATKTEMTDIGTLSQRAVRDVHREARGTLNEDSLSDAWLYYKRHQVTVVQWNMQSESWVPLAPRLLPGMHGVAMRKMYFGEGAERLVRKFRWVAADGATFNGIPMVAKETRFISDLQNDDLRRFHKVFCMTQQRAKKLAEEFNKKLTELPGVDHTVPRITFLECSVYMVDDKDRGRHGVLVEKMLDPMKYKKWNDNRGYVDGGAIPHADEGSTAPNQMLPIMEEDEEQEEKDSEDKDGRGEADSHSYYRIQNVDIPQAFSHFTYRHTERQMLVCDLQGVLTTGSLEPKFEFTDPVIHYWSRTGRRNVHGRTDQGKHGIYNFFKTHECSELCRMLNRRWLRTATRGQRFGGAREADFADRSTFTC